MTVHWRPERKALSLGSSMSMPVTSPGGQCGLTVHRCGWKMDVPVLSPIGVVRGMSKREIFRVLEAGTQWPNCGYMELALLK